MEPRKLLGTGDASLCLELVPQVLAAWLLPQRWWRWAARGLSGFSRRSGVRGLQARIEAVPNRPDLGRGWTCLEAES